VALIVAAVALLRGRVWRRGGRVLQRFAGNLDGTEPKLSARFYFSPDDKPVGPNSGVLITNKSPYSVHEVTVEALPESDEDGGMPHPSLTIWDRRARIVTRRLHVGTVQAGDSAFVAAVPQASAGTMRLRVTCRSGRREWVVHLAIPVGPRSRWR